MNHNQITYIKYLIGKSSNPSVIADAVEDYLIENPPTSYTHPASHPASMITVSSERRFVSDEEKDGWNNKANEVHTHSGYALSDHTHSLTPVVLVVSGDKATGANTTPVTTGITFDYEANKTYILDFYMVVSPGAASTGCGFSIDVSGAVTYAGTFLSHQLAASGTVSGSGTIGDRGATSHGVSSGMVGTGSNYVGGTGLLITAGETGTATIYFRSETTAVTTCKSGSVVLVTKVN